MSKKRPSSETPATAQPVESPNTPRARKPADQSKAPAARKRTADAPKARKPAAPAAAEPPAAPDAAPPQAPGTAEPAPPAGTVAPRRTRKSDRPPASKAPARGRKHAAPATARAASPTGPARGEDIAQDPLDVVMVASEARPFATTGGLSEVLGALPQALAALGHRVTVILPKYRATVIPSTANPAAGGGRTDPGPGAETILELGSRRQAVRFHEVPFGDRVTAVLVDVPDLFDREGLYGTADGDYPDNAYRFAVFSRAALEYVRARGVRPSVIHTHDWQAGLVPAYQKMLFSDDPTVGGVPAVFTIHNLAFQGLFPAGTIDEIGLPWEVFHVQAMEFWGRISFLKAGVNFSERLTTVSPTYAREILTTEHGCGFEGVLSRRARSLVGILNGIDTTAWNPAADPVLPVAYSAEDPGGKRDAKRLLLQTAGLPGSDAAMIRPLIGMVSRLTDQKGFDLLAGAADELMRLDATWVLLGSGERRYEEMWDRLAKRYPGRVSATIGFDSRLEHLIEGGADAFLMPSRFEPCGLNQLNSLRYGTLPIVRATGGLEDTVRDAAEPGGTGFKFADATPEALVGAVRRALELYGNPEQWRAMQQAAMRGDYSWDVPAREYVKVYRATS